MPNVFLSYNRRADRERARLVRTKLEALGITVFQDIDMDASAQSSEFLDAQIKDAAAALVLWTNSSTESPWVKAEAHKALQRKVLVSAVFDNIPPENLPLPFNSLN